MVQVELGDSFATRLDQLGEADATIFILVGAGEAFCSLLLASASGALGIGDKLVGTEASRGGGAVGIAGSWARPDRASTAPVINSRNDAMPASNGSYALLGRGDPAKRAIIDVAEIQSA
jgi:hypothetical protein